jgi:hypothetical protein
VAGLHFADFRRLRQLWEKHTVAHAEEFQTVIKQAVPSIYEALSQFDQHWEHWEKLKRSRSSRPIVPGFWRLRPVEKGRP